MITYGVWQSIEKLAQFDQISLLFKLHPGSMHKCSTVGCDHVEQVLIVMFVCLCVGASGKGSADTGTI